DKESVVENVVVRKRRALRKASGAGCELDVDRLVELQLRGELRDALGFRGAASLHDFREAERSRMPAVADENDRAQRRQAAGFEFAGLSTTEFRRQLAERADVIRGLELFGEDERLATDLGQRIFEFGDAVGRIDIDQNETRFGGGELGQHPLA